MATNWTGPYAWAFAPGDFATKKSVSDTGRTVDEIYCLSADGNFEGNGFGTGSITVPFAQRDNWPLITEGDTIYAFSRQSQHTRSGIAVIAIFIVEGVKVNPGAADNGTVTYSGPGIAKELQRKILRIPYISTEYNGTTTAWTDTYIFLDAAHQAADDFYNGGIIEIDGYMCEIDDYTNADNRAYVKNWLPGNPDSGGTTTYKIYHGKATNNITQAIANAQTGWSTALSGTPGGTFHSVDGRKPIDLINQISEETGYVWATNITDTPLRTLFWFDSFSATPTASGLQLYKVTAANRATIYGNVNQAPVVTAERTKDQRAGVTRLIVTSGDNVSLVGANPGDFTVPSGYSLNVSESMIIATNDEVGLTSYEIVEQAEQFQNITKASDTPEALLVTQQRLIDAGVNFLRQRSISGYTYVVTTVARRDASIGQTVYLEYEKNISGEVIWSIADNLWVRSFSNSASAATGIRYTTYILGENYHQAPQDGNAALADRLKRQDAGPGAAGSVIITGGGSGPVDHGNTIGLEHDDHAQYLLASGARELAGNMSVAAGATIDGVDLSAHAADEFAHHQHENEGGSGIWPYNIAEGRNIDLRYYDDFPGDKIFIDLAPRVEISKILRIAPSAGFEMWDATSEQYRRVFLSTVNNQPILQFADASNWAGTTLHVRFTVTQGTTLREDRPVRIPHNGTQLTFDDESFIPDWVKSVDRTRWAVYQGPTEQTRAEIYELVDQNQASYTFYLKGKYTVRREIIVKDETDYLWVNIRELDIVVYDPAAA